MKKTFLDIAIENRIGIFEGIGGVVLLTKYRYEIMNLFRYPGQTLGHLSPQGKDFEDKKLGSKFVPGKTLRVEKFLNLQEVRVVAEHSQQGLGILSRSLLNKGRIEAKCHPGPGGRSINDDHLSLNFKYFFRFSKHFGLGSSSVFMSISKDQFYFEISLRLVDACL